MSWNIILSGTRDSDPKFLLTRASTGVTNSAKIARDDWIEFEDTGIIARVVEIRHKWERPGTLIAPNSTARCITNRILTREDCDKLREIGFKEINNDN